MILVYFTPFFVLLYIICKLYSLSVLLCCPFLRSHPYIVCHLYSGMKNPEMGLTGFVHSFIHSLTHVSVKGTEAILLTRWLRFHCCVKRVFWVFFFKLAVVELYSFLHILSLPFQGIDLDWCKQPEIGLIKPDLVIYINLRIEKAIARAAFGEERYEKIEFQKTVNQLFKQLEDPSYWKVRFCFYVCFAFFN